MRVVAPMVRFAAACRLDTPAAVSRSTSRSLLTRLPALHSLPQTPRNSFSGSAGVGRHGERRLSNVNWVPCS
jgi:hypothetical protein